MWVEFTDLKSLLCDNQGITKDERGNESWWEEWIDLSEAKSYETLSLFP